MPPHAIWQATRCVMCPSGLAIVAIHLVVSYMNCVDSRKSMYFHCFNIIVLCACTGTSRLAVMEGALTEVRQENSSLCDQLTGLQSHCSGLEEERDSLHQTVDELRTELNGAQATLDTSEITRHHICNLLYYRSINLQWYQEAVCVHNVALPNLHLSNCVIVCSFLVTR